MSSHVAEKPPVVATSIKSSLPLQAIVYLLVVLATAVALGAHFLRGVQPGDLSIEQWATFALLATASSLAQLFVVITPRNQSYHMTIVFLVPAALLLPPELLPVIAVVQHVPEWLKQRYAWYIQSFNIANYTLDLLAAWATARVLLDSDWLIGDESVRTGAAWVASAVVFVAANHVLLAVMLRLGRGHSWRTSGLFSFESLSTDLVLATMGVLVASTWHTNRWLVALALAPLILIHRSLGIPVLEEEARVDSKTGLFNTRHFTATLGDELDRAARFERPVSLLMIDLDLLRDINNSYGHLAGDAVLQGIAAVFRKELRHCDVPARFGGEEFCILLPDTPREAAVEVAERIRRAVEAGEFVVETSTDPIHATISIGVAAFPCDGTKASELIHHADVAVYEAKLQGRNRVAVASGGQALLPTEPAHAATPNGEEQASTAREKLREATATIQRQNRSLEQANRQLQERSMAAMESLAAAVDARDSYTAGHSRRVQRLALAVGRELGLSAEELDVLGSAALFHDIGKLAVPDSILLKPAALTPAEWESMQGHADEGARIIARLGFLDDAVPAIRHHHEHWDGSGYPAGLAADEIPLGARIIHVVDAVDSMLSSRLYRAGQPLDKVLREVRAGAGTQFCPRCVRALESAIASRPADELPLTEARVELAQAV